MEIHLIKALEDNLIWLIKNDNNEAMIIDAGEAKPVLDFLEKNSLKLKYILITHKHSDHIEGIAELVLKTQAQTIGNMNFQSSLPKLDFDIADLKSLNPLGLEVIAMETPGHCEDHIAYYTPQEKWLFSGDCLFTLGCGRVFEGSPNVMFNSLQKIKALPKETMVYCGHDYRKSNLRFAQSLGLAHGLKLNDVPLASTLGAELKNNPFLSKLSNKEEGFIKLREARNKF
jgi:hydroxyacylglutathione hydrolase